MNETIITTHHDPDCGSSRNSLASPQLAPFARKDNEPIIDAVTLERGHHVAS